MCKSGEKSESIIMEVSEDSDSDNSIMMTDSDSEQEQSDENINSDSEKDESQNVTENPEEEEEDEVIKAIRLASKKKNNHPPTITMEEDIMNILFHPQEDILAVADVSGDVHLYKYSLEENTCLHTLELHTDSCNDISFSEDGKVMYTVGSDKSIMLSDSETQELIKFYEDAHEYSINCISVIDEHHFATGDIEGNVRLWDKRTPKQIYKAKRNEDYISSMITDKDKRHLFCTSGDGSLTTFNLRTRSFLVQSDEYDEDFTCLGLFRTEQKLAVGTNRGKILFFNQNQYGLHSDIFPAMKTPINSMIPITQNILVAACDDGIIRAIHLFPHRHLGIVGQHENMSVEKVCTRGELLASYSPDNHIRFWNIDYFEEFEKVNHKHNKHNTKKEMRKNLPSSRYSNASDFFKDMVE